jgi:hypothetical protein
VNKSVAGVSEATASLKRSAGLTPHSQNRLGGPHTRNQRVLQQYLPIGDILVSSGPGRPCFRLWRRTAEPMRIMLCFREPLTWQFSPRRVDLCTVALSSGIAKTRERENN